MIEEPLVSVEGVDVLEIPMSDDDVLLTTYRARCARVLARIDGGAAKLNNLRRGLQRRLDEYDRLIAYIDGTETVDMMVDFFAKKLLQGADFHRSLEQMLAVIDRRTERLIMLIREIHGCEEEIEEIETGLLMKERLEARMAEIVAKLRCTEDGNGAGMSPMRRIVEQDSHVSVVKGGASFPVIPKRRARGIQQSNEQQKQEDVQAAFDIFALDLNKIREAMRIADENKVSLRVVVAPEGNVRRRNSEQWMELIRVLGFRGDVKFVVYEELRINDGNSPIIMPRRLNTHKNRQGRYRAPMFVIELPQKLLMNSLTND